MHVVLLGRFGLQRKRSSEISSVFTDLVSTAGVQSHSSVRP